MKPFAVLVCVLALATPALAEGELQSILTANDQARLAQFDANKVAALTTARGKGSVDDVKVLDAALAGQPLKTEGGFDATGAWRCRIIKLGGSLPLTVYPYFRCKVTDDGAGWFLQKVSGSQRVQGRFYTESATRLIFVGAGHVQGDPPRNYGDDPEENQVAVAERLGERRLVLQFPKPHYESEFDLLVLER